GFRAGDAVTPYYDPLLAKLVVWGENRGAVLVRMQQALREFEIGGVTSNLAFLRHLMQHPQVENGEVDTGFIERELAALAAAAPFRALDMAAACAAVLRREEQARSAALSSPWDRADGWMIAGRRSRRLSFQRAMQRCDAVLWYGRDGLRLEFSGTEAKL